MPAFSVILPTLNCMALLPAHLRSMRPWLDLAYEIIVVDSHSSDGTADYIRTELAGLPVRIETHPRGLYQSWNHGIGLARAELLYISTVGDSITRELLLHLHALATNGRCDVAISLPRRIDQQDQALPPPRWAVTEITSTLACTEPRVITGAAALYYAVRHHRSSALLGSTASNLYRTSHLQSRPFPTGFGTAGDAAWSMLHAFETRQGFTPMPGSTFRIHEKSYAEAEYHVEDLHQKLLQTALSTLAQHAADVHVRNLRIEEDLQLQDKSRHLYADLKTFRQKHRPWFFHPEAWRMRAASRQARRQLDRNERNSFTLIRDSLSEVVDLPS